MPSWRHWQDMPRCTMVISVFVQSQGVNRSSICWREGKAKASRSVLKVSEFLWLSLASQTLKQFNELYFESVKCNLTVCECYFANIYRKSVISERFLRRERQTWRPRRLCQMCHDLHWIFQSCLKVILCKRIQSYIQNYQ